MGDVKMEELELIHWDLYRRLNIQDHRTSDYLTPHLVVRRGQSFYISCSFNREVRPEKDVLDLFLEIGDPSVKATFLEYKMPVFQTCNSTSWEANCINMLGTSMTIAVHASRRAVVGRYKLFLKILNEAGNGNKQILGYVYILFNPWVQGDEVFMPIEEERREYVLNDTGLILYGHEPIINSRPWDFGQFEEDILDIIFSLYDQSLDVKRDPEQELIRRSCAEYVSRTLCGMVNHHNENSILLGNWTGDYKNGVSPTTWNGSVPILRSWRQNGPVSFGQCWVSAGVLCTMLRCLGIPTRLVTIFDAARHTDKQFRIARVFSESARPMPEKSPGLWCFHTLTEMWMRRPDIHDHSDWQVLDTDSGASYKGIHRLGPASLIVIKEGFLTLDTDATIFFAELNCQIYEQIFRYNTSKPKGYTNFHPAGKFVGTKALGVIAIADVTDAHKYAAGTPKAREILTKAQNIVLRKQSLMSTARESIENPENLAPKPDFTGNFEPGQPSQVGEDFTTTLILKNTNDETKVIEVNLRVHTMVYTRAPLKDILIETRSISLGPNEEKKMPYTITYSQYKNVLKNDNLIRFVAVCFDDKEGSLVTQSVVTLSKPRLLIKVCGNPVFNTPLNVEIIFSNPLNEDISNGHLVVEGSGLLRKPVALYLPIVKSKQTCVTMVTLLPYRAGPRMLMVNFNSFEFYDIKSFMEITIPPLHIH
ncbi:protein-glutamine gamma-glutamyltransferase E-like [Pelobates fuscus]|uniref:protein-glutamine gamma-glutamyltransferase E-like n=1 Tax=Pelobates fuscus TaxID=191477 RepID=UPI002FE4621A